MGTYKKGISLIVLVITIIVLAILATTVILTLNSTNIIEETNNSVFKSDMANYKELYAFYIVDKFSEDSSFDMTTINASYGDATFTEIFGDNVPNKYIDGLKIQNGKIIYDTDDATEIEVLEELGMVAGTGGTQTPVKMQIGDLVAYTPTADPKESYDGATYETTDEDGKKIESKTKYTPGTLTWVYLGQDENGNILLTSQEATSFTMTIGGQDGWVTGPDRLDALCNTLYGNSTYGYARNMKVEDVNRILGYNDHDGVVEDGEGPLGMYYDIEGNEVPTPTSKTIGDIETELGTKLTNRTAPRKLADQNKELEDCFSDAYTYTGTDYEPDTTTAGYKIIFKKADGKANQSRYWLSSASACAYFCFGYANFSVRTVNGGVVDAYRVFESSYEYGDSFALRPVIVLKTNIQFGEPNATGEWTLEVT